MSIIERYHDPEEAFSYKWKKRDKIKRGLEKYDKRIFKMLTAKLGYELMDFEVKEVVTIFLIKKNNLHVKGRKFGKQIMQIFNEFNGQVEAMSLANEAAKEKAQLEGSTDARQFPISQKDFDVRNINQVKEKRRLEEERKKMLRKQKEQEFHERKALKKFDYDVPHKAVDVESEEDGYSGADGEGGVDMGDSFYIMNE
jgi:hypothetical protein